MDLAERAPQGGNRRLRIALLICGGFLLCTVLGLSRWQASSSPLAGLGRQANGTEPPRDFAAGKAQARSKTINSSETAAILRRTEERFQSALERDPHYRQYLHCIGASTTRAQCHRHLSDALYSAASHSLEPFVGIEAANLKKAMSGDVTGLREQLASTVAQESSPLKSMVALMLLQHVDPEHAFPLPKGAYHDLAERTDPEAQIILEGHAVIPFPDPAIPDEVADMALDSDVSERVRLSSVRALGRSQDAPSLGKVVLAFTSGNPSTTGFAVDALPRALASCGMACAPFLETLAAHDSREVRDVAYRVLRQMPDSSRPQLERRIIELSPQPYEVAEQELRAVEP
jgi:hypothetical protein